jgi:hypothetical protein
MIVCDGVNNKVLPGRASGLIMIVDKRRRVCYCFHDVYIGKPENTRLMNYHSLATIDNQRRLTHDAGQVVYLNWDHHAFCFTRAGLSRFARTLQQGMAQLYAGRRDYSVVTVDDEYREVWVEAVCLSLNRRDYRALLNAVLTTETRLHGFRTKQQEEEVDSEPTITYSAPPPLRFCWN